MGESGVSGLILFDLDDTLLDNVDADVGSFMFALRRQKIPCPDRDLIVAWRQEGMLARDMLLKILGNASLADECMKDRRKYLNGIRGRRLLRLKPDARAVLLQLRPRYRIVIVTARPRRDAVYSILRDLGISECVDGVLCSQDYKGAEGDRYDALKASLYEKALAAHCIKKEMCVAVGNLKSDVAAGIASGIRAYAVRGSYGFDRSIGGMAPAFESLTDLARAL